MAGWQKLELSAPNLPIDPLTEIINILKSLIAALTEILELLLEMSQAVMDPVSTAIKQLIEILKETVNSLLGDVGLYFLYVPIQKRFETNFLNLNDITPPIADKLGIFSQPTSAADWNNPNLAKMLVNANRYSGGNAGFFSTVVGSLDDTGDIMRPQFTSSLDHIAGVTMVMGTNVDPLGFLQDIWTLMNMFKLPTQGAINQVAAPTGLKGRALSKPVNGKFDVFLQWDHMEVPLVSLPNFGNIVMYPVEVAVLRVQNDVTFMAARSPQEIFGQNRLNKGLVFGDANVVDIFPFNASDTTYIDTGVSTTGPFGDDIYYYAVAWRFKAFKGAEEYRKDDGTVLDYWQISNVVEIIPDPTLPGSTPPDWVRTPSLASIFPGLARLLQYLVAQIESIAAVATTSLDILSSYIDFLKSEVRRYEQIAFKILDLVEKMAMNFDLPTTGIYFRPFSGQGGNTFFVTDLANSLCDGFENAPPFHKGDEYVTGIILLAGGPLHVVEAFNASISLLFGDVSSGLEARFDQLEQNITLAENLAYSFDDRLDTSRGDLTVEFSVSDDSGDTNNLGKITCCNLPDETEYTFDENFKPIEKK